MQTMHPHAPASQRARWRPGIIGALLAAAIAVAGGRVALADQQGDVPKIPFERYTLDNGLEVILHQDNSVPLVAVSVWYHVGAGNEVPGRSGFAHLFEHMLFQGSKHVGEDRHFDLLKQIGATAVNGSTSNDRTNYYEVVPSHQLETALWIESDRMGYLLPMLTQKSLDNQIEVVRNERRQRVDNVPYGKSEMILHEMLYPETHPFRYVVIGRHEDLAAGTLEDVRNFYKTWYVPANATLALAGDFDTAEAKKLVQKWFGTFPKSTRPAKSELAAMREPAVSGQARRAEISDDFAKLRMLVYAWHSPASFAPGDAELDILAHALGSQGTGRLYQSLVHREQLAQRVSVYQDSQQGSSVFMIRVMLRSDADLARVEQLIDEELERVRTQPLAEREIARAVTGVESRFVWGLEGLLSRAEALQRYNHYVGTPDYVRQEIERYTKASAEDVRRVAGEYLARDRRVELLTVPAAKETK